MKLGRVCVSHLSEIKWLRLEFGNGGLDTSTLVDHPD